ncbi:SMP-30/gluconolactonase/LRE family protein [Verticiella sediminum]|uniref:SMP-30/gluconolactonase/LRE family protein n=1 Tax=Verticiella sediminum TaxID=1247510 RepID=A0A556ARK5_9BURK|nr:SMP-30/gluconolactonase/LRE family protein [Verticiella sediminum]TSH95568.1 SMP-30/gluconolactonase/LRE family protein [Verticiella sediminum]
MFIAPPAVTAEVYARIPAELWKAGRREGILEGPVFDADGNLYVVNVPHGQIFRITPQRVVELVLEYDGEPNGLKLDQQGRLFIADHRQGLLKLDPASGRLDTVLARGQYEPFRGLNDLCFNRAGDLFFTDQGESDLRRPDGRLWVLRADGRLELLLDAVPSPNGLVVTPDDRFLYLAVTRANAVWRVPLRRAGGVGRVGAWIQLSGGVGPDGLTLDAHNRLYVAHAGMGSVWVFDERGRPALEVCSPEGNLVTNVVLGGPDERSLYITLADTHTVLKADLKRAGLGR